MGEGDVKPIKDRLADLDKQIQSFTDADPLEPPTPLPCPGTDRQSTPQDTQDAQEPTPCPELSAMRLAAFLS
ncbi:hypothetical protein ACFQ7F_42555 [Streptomyces sp. NPDC056486]|uniref:hypothetical protein n=1 Tax=Streptomyces sp. NPDC056486 TaxID=3345835 RepID=UPI003693AEDD